MLDEIHPHGWKHEARLQGDVHDPRLVLLGQDSNHVWQAHGRLLRGLD
jgi:hypothetical protein